MRKFVGSTVAVASLLSACGGGEKATPSTEPVSTPAATCIAAVERSDWRTMDEYGKWVGKPVGKQVLFDTVEIANLLGVNAENVEEDVMVAPVACPNGIPHDGIFSTVVSVEAGQESVECTPLRVVQTDSTGKSVYIADMACIQ